MDDSLRERIGIYLARLAALIRRGEGIREALAANPTNAAAIANARLWQEECGVTVNQLSGGSKAHWLARAFSEAFLMRSAAGRAVEEALPQEIVQRLLEVLEKAVVSLSSKDNGPILSASVAQEPAAQRFDFVHNRELRPIVEQAYTDSRKAFERGDYDEAMRISCGILEAIVTDELEHKGLRALGGFGMPSETIAEWPFETRLAVAEKAGLIRGGCARLPGAARKYRDQDAGGTVPGAVVSERDARVTGQVLHVVMRDLNPGR